MSTGDVVRQQLDRTIDAHRRSHHRQLARAREARRIRSQVDAALASEAPPVPDLAPEGLPAGQSAMDPLEGL